MMTDSQTVGKIRFASGGIGWKDERSGKVTTVPKDDMKRIYWQKVAKDFGLRILLKSGRVVRFDGFPEDSFDEIKIFLGRLYDLDIELRELSAKGWNWGQTEFSGLFLNHAKSHSGDNLVFSVTGKPALEIPMSEVVNSSMASKNEVSLEFKGVPDSSTDRDAMKGDQLMEMRFFIPNKAEEDAEVGEDVNAAANFFETVKTMADIGVVTEDSIVPLHELPFLVPRGRYEVDLFADFMRLHGKSYDYKILYKSVKKLFVLPKPDDVHILLVVALDPPIRQGQTRYPYLVMQFLADENLEVTLTLDQSELDTRFDGKLKKEYDALTADVVSEVLGVVTGVNLTRPSSFRGKNGACGVKCSYKANEGHIYPLDESLLFVPKPATNMPYSSISVVTFSRVNQGGSSTFDMKITLKKGTDFQFGGLYKDEHALLEEYFKLKGLKIKTDAAENEIVFNQLSSSDDEDGPRAKKVKTGDDDGDEDEEEDGDFVAGDESDVAEEFDEEYASSGGEDEEE